MNLKDYRTIFIAITLIGVLLAASPALSVIISLPKTGEKFSEFWYVDQTHMIKELPFNIRNDTQYIIYLDIVNHMDYSIYYAVYVKLRNETQPPATRSLPSPLPPVYEFRTFLQDEATWETPFLFSFPEISISNGSCSVNKLMINNNLVSVDVSANWKEMVVAGAVLKGFYFQLFFELWFCDTSQSEPTILYHNRFLSLKLNMTG